MAPIDEAIKYLESQEPEEQSSYESVAKKFGVVASTLRRRHKGGQGSRAAKNINQRALSPQQEKVLVKHIEALTARRLPPTRDMIRNFASVIAKKDVSEAWVTRFINRNKDTVIPKWTSAMDAVRHNADSYTKYRMYFDLIHETIARFNIEASNTYNMDEKGFMIGIVGRSKRIFDKRMWEKKEVTAAMQDGEREFITCLATICADGSALPPALIFAALGDLRDTWVAGIEAGKHEVFCATSPTGWSNNDIGLSWLEQVFQRATKEKALRDYRLLIVDGHGSHLTMDFINYCDSKRILLAILPPHSTHTLQPLDVVMFKPLAAAYSKELTNHIHTTQGLIPINKTDFFPLFWQAWTSSFKKETILKAWEATGIWPQAAERVLKRFNHESSDESEASEDSLAAIEGNFQRVQRLLRSAVKDPASDEARSLSLTIHQLQADKDMAEYKNEQLQDALQLQSRHQKQSKPLDLQQRRNWRGGTVLWSPRKIREANTRQGIKEREEKEERLRIDARKAQQALNKTEKEKEAERKRVDRENKKVEQQKKKADEAATKARKAAEKKAAQEAATSQKLAQQANKLKRKASHKAPSKSVKKRRVGGAAASGIAHEPAPAPPPKASTRGRNIKLPAKYR
jgi:hypothetical protein